MALSVLCLTVVPSSSIVAAVCCSALACCSVRPDRSWLPCAICALAVATLSELSRTSVTTCTRLLRMRARPAIKLSVSPGLSTICTVRSPCATAFTVLAASLGSAPSWRKMLRVSAQPSTPVRASRPRPPKSSV